MIFSCYLKFPNYYSFKAWRIARYQSLSNRWEYNLESGKREQPNWIHKM
jgi:hypothetical protein